MPISSAIAHVNTGSDFDIFAASVAKRFSGFANSEERCPLFTVDAGDLYSLYLGTFADPVQRQHHTCSCCRQFIQRYGNLATINDDGSLSSVMWCDDGSLPELFRPAAAALSRAIQRGKVAGPFHASEKVWGTPVTGEWHHFAVTPNPSILHRDRLLTPYQVTAQKKQDFGTLSHGLADFDRATVAAALNLLEADAVYRAEKVMGPARFLLNLHDTIADVKGDRRKNLIWRAVASAPVGFATPRSSMVGTLLEDIAAGMPLDAVKRRFAEKMHPLQYQRPQAAPTAGNIAQAESIVQRLGLAPALRRRFARIEEVQLIWKPSPQEAPQKAGGVFGHLLKGAAGNAPSEVAVQTITWAKFSASVLPRATAIKVLMKPGLNFAGVLTAVDPDAPPILQWDREGHRNPVSWYVWNGGSSPSQWKLPSQGWVAASGVMLKPSMWGTDGRAAHHGSGAIVILDGAQETRLHHGLALFPECLRAELHSIRSTIEAFSRRGEIEGADQGSANGLMIGPQGSGTSIRVTTELGTVDYTIDRWD